MASPLAGAWESAEADYKRLWVLTDTSPFFPDGYFTNVSPQGQVQKKLKRVRDE